MYGGVSGDGSSVDYDDVWVLSIPSFQWHQAGHTPVRGRSDHSCSVAGQRQMVIIGGLDPDGDGPPYQSVSPDIWPLGLNVFDLSDMVFKDRYDPDASSYTSPEVVKRWYAENGPMARDVSHDVRVLFDRSTTTSSTSGSAPSSTDPQPSASSANSGSSVNTGAIAGGVVGGVVAIAAVIAWVWILTKRRRSRQSRAPTISNTFESDGRPMFEADGRQTYHEKEGLQRHEKEALQPHEREALQRHELQ